MPETPARHRVLIINAGLNGTRGNTAVVLARAAAHLAPHLEVTSITLADGANYASVGEALARSHAVVIGTGTHWDSWSHLLQRLLEDATADEGSALWLGKPAAVFVTMHSVGGKAVLSRLQGVLNTFGCAIPPMSGLVYSLVNQAAIEAGASGADDVWCLDDVAVVCDNLLAALALRPAYRAWPTDRERFNERWIR
jgi:chromate reductase